MYHGCCRAQFPFLYTAVGRLVVSCYLALQLFAYDGWGITVGVFMVIVVRTPPASYHMPKIGVFSSPAGVQALANVYLYKRGAPDAMKYNETAYGTEAADLEVSEVAKGVP